MATITNTIYVSNHYEVFFTEASKDYQGQFFAIESPAMEALIQGHVDEYVAGNPTSLVGVMEVTDTPAPTLTPEEIAYNTQEELVNTLQAEKNALRSDLVELQEYTKNLLNTKDLFVTVPTEYTDIEATLQTDLTTRAAEFNAKLIEYRTEKTILEGM